MIKVKKYDQRIVIEISLFFTNILMVLSRKTKKGDS